MSSSRHFPILMGRMFVASTLAAAVTLAWGQTSPVQSVAASPAITSGQPLSLAQAIELALARNPDISVARREWEATRGAVIQAGLRPNPEFSAQQEDLRRNRSTTTLQFTQPIERGGKRAARTALAERVRDQAAIDIDQARADIRAQAILSYYETLIAQERLRLAREALQLAADGADATSKRVQAGKVAPVEETRARVVQAAAQAELVQAEGGYRAARQRLFSLWGNTAVTDTPLLEKLDLPADGTSQADLQSRLGDSVVIRRARLELERARAAVDLEQARRRTDVSVSFGIKRAQETGTTAAVVGVSVPLALFDRNQGNLAEALSRADKAEDELTATELRLNTEVFQANEALRSARAEALTLQRDAVPGARTAYELASRGFVLGKFSYLEALDAQRTLVATQSQYLRALLDTYRAATELERLLGISSTTSSLLTSTSR